MKSVMKVSILAATMFLAGHATLFAQNWGRPQTPSSGVCFYEDVNFGGRYYCVSVGSTNGMMPYGPNNEISSIRIFGNAEVTVYADRDLRGRSHTFTNDVVDLRRSGWNDRITSFRVDRGSDRGLAGRGRGREGSWAGRWGRPPTPSNGACFYENINFEGQYFCARTGELIDMVPQGTNDAISSIRVFGNTEVAVFQDRDFSGQSRRFDRDVRDLRDVGWNDLISSFRVVARGSEPNFGNRGRGVGLGRGNTGGGLGATFGGVVGRLEWRGRVDDKVQLVIRGQSLEQRTISGTGMGNGNAQFTSPLPAEAVRVSVNKISGRGTVRVIQQPSRLNDFTAVIEIFDEGGGSQEYRIEVNWR